MSDSIEEDFRLALEELTTNDRYAISNLTLIAKESVAAAESISRCLVNHINRAPPSRKLPALYLLDSISKNVGSPYTIYFSRNLYGVFMGAFSQVDDNVRRKLEEMLRTWREPVPGSTSTQPVFQLAATQTIVDNLNKLRASAPQRYPPPGQPRMPHFQPQRDTPTPPQQLPQRPPSQAQVCSFHVFFAFVTDICSTRPINRLLLCISNDMPHLPQITSLLLLNHRFHRALI